VPNQGKSLLSSERFSTKQKLMLMLKSPQRI